MSVYGPPPLRPHRRSHRPELRHPDGQQALEADGAARITGVTDGVDLVEPGGFGQAPLPSDQDAGPAVAEVQGHLGAPEQHVERHRDAARLKDPEVRDQELRDVGQLQRDGLAGLGACRRQ